MSTRIARLSWIAILVFAAPVSWAKDKAQPASSPEVSLVVGDSYTIRAERHGARKRFRGDLVKATDRWLVLHYLTKGSDRSMTNLAKTPVVGRWFRAAIIPPADEFIWIPREAAYIESHTAAKTESAAATKIGDDPAEQVACTIEFAKGERIERRDGGMESVSEGGFTVAVPKKVSVEAPLSGFGLASLASEAMARTRTETRYSRQLISRSDVLCVRVGNLHPSILSIGSR